MVTINLDGPDGNAFALMGYARRFAKQLGWEPSRIDLLMYEMRQSDYEHLLDVFKREFKDIATLERSDPDDEE